MQGICNGWHNQPKMGVENNELGDLAIRDWDETDSQLWDRVLVALMNRFEAGSEVDQHTLTT